MGVTVVMPKLGEVMEFGVLVRWLKEEGEFVAKGEELFEVETEKITVVVESPAGGRLRRQVVEGVEVNVGDTVAELLPA